MGEFFSKYGLSVNLSKSKVVVFRNGGPLRHHEQFHFNDSELKHVYVKIVLVCVTHTTFQMHLCLEILAEHHYQCDIIINIGQCNFG